MNTPTSSPANLTGLSRATWVSIQERDLDLLLLDLLHTSAGFRRWLLDAVAPDVIGLDAEGGFLGAWHSVSTPNGESDLEAEWKRPDGTRFAMLIEDKLGAAFQPDQGLRYIERAAGYRMSGRATHTRVVLIAPAAYPARDAVGCAPFERHLSIESLIAWCEAGRVGDRSTHTAAFLRQALARAGGSPRGASRVDSATGTTSHSGKPQFPEFYAEIHALLQVRRPPMGGVTGVASQAPGEWVYFAFPRKSGSGASLRWRLRDHWVELVIPIKKVSRDAVEAALLDDPLPGAAIATRGTSEVVVWLPTIEVDAFAPAPPQRQAIDQALTTSDALSQWYVRSLGTRA